MSMKEPLLLCPECGNPDVLVRSMTSYYVNTGEFFCHSVKTHDSDAPVSCLLCDWDGLRQDLVEES